MLSPHGKDQLQQLWNAGQGLAETAYPKKAYNDNFLLLLVLFIRDKTDSVNYKNKKEHTNLRHVIYTRVQ